MPLPIITFKTSKVEQFAQNVIQSKERVADLRPFWSFLWKEYIVEETKRVFETDGYGKWPERKTGGDHPLLRKSGKLYRSYTQQRIRDHINRETDGKWIFGTANPYAGYHERLTRGVKRPVIGTLYDTLGGGVGQGRIEELFRRYFIDGQFDVGTGASANTRLTRRIRRGFINRRIR